MLQPIRVIAISSILIGSNMADADYVEVRRNANVYNESNTSSTVVDRIRPGESDQPIYLRIADDALENGYHNVVLRQGGGDGWIYKSRVRRFPGDPPSTPESQRDVIASGSFVISDDVMVAHFINVGQGDATLLEFSCGAVLIDTGGEMTDEVNGTDNLIAYLNNFFDRRADLNRTLDLLAVTHAHIDHTRSIPRILDQPYTVRSAIDNGFRHGSGGAQQGRLQDHANAATDVSYQAIREEDIQLASGLSNGTIDPIDCSGTDPEIRVLWGSLDDDPGWASGAFNNGNNHSIVIRVDFGDTSFLFTGDLQEAAIEDLVLAYSDSDTLDVDVYQVGHHGSHNATTQELMEAMTPRLAVISMGDSSLSRAIHSAYSYGHPRDNVIELLTDTAHGVTAFRDQEGNVPVASKGACNSCNPRRPPVFNNYVISKAVLATGWDGTIRISVNSAGIIVIDTSS